MSLRTRLWLVVGALVVLPLVVAAVLVGVLAPRVASSGAEDRVTAGAAAVRASIADRCTVLAVTARALASEALATSPGQALTSPAGSQGDYAALLGPGGAVVADRGSLPESGPGPGEVRGCSRGGDPAVVAEVVPVEATSLPGVSSAVIADTLSADYLSAVRDRLRLGDSASVTLLGPDGELLLSTAEPSQARALAAAAAGAGSGESELEVDGLVAAVVPTDAGLPWTVVVADEPPGVESLVRRLLLALLALAAVAVVLGLVIARGFTRPLEDLTDAADRVTRGDLTQTVHVDSGDEVGRVSAAFNRLTRQLRRNIDDLERTNEELRGGLARMGEALKNTHEAEKLLRVVLDVAVLSTQAEAAVALVHDGTGIFQRKAVLGMVEAGLPVPDRVEVGTGVIGAVAATGTAFRGRLDSADAPAGPLDVEPAQGEALVVPLQVGTRVVGVLALYGRRRGQPFGPEQEKQLRTLADQAAIAVDNIRLHKEAERLSMTDPLTGLRNFRYLSSELAREIERASRFARPLAVLMLDLDHFKSVNDTYGHARGDAVLRELASRVSEQIREVDTLARYGGEEFVIVLPETSPEGAGMLAERVCAAVRRHPFTQGGGEPLRITLSIGAASFPTHGESAATLMRAADEALYVAKRAGRDRWHLAEAPQPSR